MSKKIEKTLASLLFALVTVVAAARSTRSYRTTA